MYVCVCVCVCSCVCERKREVCVHASVCGSSLSRIVHRGRERERPCVCVRMDGWDGWMCVCVCVRSLSPGPSVL